jgi:hypothetical protein
VCTFLFSLYTFFLFSSDSIQFYTGYSQGVTERLHPTPQHHDNPAIAAPTSGLNYCDSRLMAGAGSARASACPHGIPEQSYGNKHYTPVPSLNKSNSLQPPVKKRYHLFPSNPLKNPLQNKNC